MQLKDTWYETQKSRSSTQLHEVIRRFRSHGTCDTQEGKTNLYFLPHHPVFKQTSTTTNTRVVFDGGVKTSNGLSFNDLLQVSPTVQQHLYSIVLRFRTHQACFTADIAKMFRQFVVHTEDREFYGDIHLKNTFKGTDLSP